MATAFAENFEVHTYSVYPEDFASAGVGLFHFESVADFDVHKMFLLTSEYILCDLVLCIFANFVPEFFVDDCLSKDTFGGVFFV